MGTLNLNDRVCVIGRNVCGKIAYIGETHISEGEWFGIILDEPKGRNNGCLDGRRYFKCTRNYGIFVRACQLEKEGASVNIRERTVYPNYLGVSPYSRAVLDSCSKMKVCETEVNQQNNSECSFKSKSGSSIDEKESSDNASGKIKSFHLIQPEKLGQGTSADFDKDRLFQGKKEFQMVGLKHVSERCVIRDEDSSGKHSETSIDSSVRFGDSSCGRLPHAGGDPLNNNNNNVIEHARMSAQKATSVKKSLESIKDTETKPFKRTSLENNMSRENGGWVKAQVRAASTENNITRKKDLKRMSDELWLAKSVNADLEKELRVIEGKYAELHKDLNKMVKCENKLKKQLITAQKQAMVFRKQLRKTEKDLEISEMQRRKLDNETQEVKEITEHVVVEKEIAEEKREQLELLLNEEFEKCKQYEVEIEILKEEMQIQSIDGIPAVHLLKKLKTENQVLSSALHGLKQLYLVQQDKLLTVEQESEGKSEAIKTLKQTGEVLETVISNKKLEITELCDVIDSVFFADEISFEVTDRNLNYENQISQLQSELNDIEDHLEVSEIISETLTGIKEICNEEIECLKFKLKRAEMSAKKNEIMIKQRDEEIGRYKELTKNLRYENTKLSEELEKVYSQKNEALVKAESLKMKSHRENRKSFRDVIDVDILKMRLDNKEEKLKYWSYFLPDELFGQNGANDVIDLKVLTSMVSKKINILVVHLRRKLLDLCKIPDPKSFQTLITGSKILDFAMKLKRVFIQIESNFDRLHLDESFTTGKFHKDLTEMKTKIDDYLLLLCNDEIDKNETLESIQLYYLQFSENIDLKCTKPSQMAELEYYMKVMKVSCEILLVFCSSITALEVNERDECNLKQISFCTRLLEVTVNKLINHWRLSDEDFEYVKPDILRKLKKSVEWVQKGLNFIFAMYKFISEADDEMQQSYFEGENSGLFTEILTELSQHQNELDMSLVKDGVFVERGREITPPSAIKTWAENVKQKRREIISNLKEKIKLLESEMSKLTQELQQEKVKNSRYIQLEKEITLKERDKDTLENKNDISPAFATLNQNASDTAPISLCSGDCSVTREYACLKLQDMESALRYISQKNFELKMEHLKARESYLDPLRVLPKLKCNADKEGICKLQKRLRELSSRLTSILVPLVVDITEKTKDKGKKYKHYLLNRALVRKSVEEEICKITCDIQCLKNPQSVFGQTWIPSP